MHVRVSSAEDCYLLPKMMKLLFSIIPTSHAKTGSLKMHTYNISLHSCVFLPLVLLLVIGKFLQQVFIVHNYDNMMYSLYIYIYIYIGLGFQINSLNGFYHTNNNSSNLQNSKLAFTGSRNYTLQKVQVIVVVFRAFVITSFYSHDKRSISRKYHRSIMCI